jgi:hypothetical protein
MLAAISLMLALAFGAGPAVAFDMLDVRQFRDSGYRWCRKCDLSWIKLKGVDLRRADLRGASLIGADLEGANLIDAKIQDAVLISAKLQNANMLGAQLQNATLRGAQLQNANMLGAQLQNATLRGARLQNANLSEASLHNANLDFASVEGANLVKAILTNALYGPISAPPNSNVAGIRGLSTVRVRYDELAQQAEVSGLVSVRELLQRAGYRDLEREATYSIERARTRAAFEAGRGGPLRALEGALRFVAFELTTGYGLYPGRALLIMLGLMLLLSFAYLPWIRQQGRTRRPRGAIYRIWPSERLVEDGRTVRLKTYGDVSQEDRAERLQAKTTLGRYGYALWFSALSAFHIGWRELSVGTWLSRLQPHEYGLRAQGWPRFISGVQSLISVYLVAIWALTYFGRPFQ